MAGTTSTTSTFGKTTQLVSQHKMPIQDYRPLMRAKIMIGKHPTLRALLPFMMCGEISIVSAPSPDGSYSFTAYTNGWDMVFCKEFMDTLTQKEVNFVMCHECCHILLKHTFICKRLFKIDAQLTGISADYQVNDWIDQLDPDRTCVEFIEGCLWDESYRGWSPLKIFKHLQKQKQEKEKEGGKWSPDGEPTDEMEFGGFDDGDSDGDKSNQSVQEKAKAMQEMVEHLDNMIAHAKHLIQEGSPNSNKMIDGEMAIKVRWQPLFEDIVLVSQQGADDQTYAIYNPRSILDVGGYDDVNPIYPTDYTDKVGEIVIAFDCSGSIHKELKVFVEQVQEILERMRPECVRILFWDTSIVSDEIYLPKDYHRFAEMIKPIGGGGTNAQCIPTYLEENNINWEACCIFTDGYLHPIEWQPSKPVLWLVVTPDGETNFVPTQGRLVPYIPDEQ
tara:strand:- start:17 stop:1354 length:1338 start_codon:yes stop_codon:yes gene_type:complete